MLSPVWKDTNLITDIGQSFRSTTHHTVSFKKRGWSRDGTLGESQSPGGATLRADSGDGWPAPTPKASALGPQAHLGWWAEAEPEIAPIKGLKPSIMTGPNVHKLRCHLL